MPTYRMDLAYDGSGFHGYARQPAVRTVQGELEDALFDLTGPVETVVAGRTDKGVHAAGQVVSFEHRDRLDADRIARSLNRRLAPEIAVLSVGEVVAGFNARFDAVQRTYRYRILNRTPPDPFLARLSWHFPGALDVDLMDVEVEELLGEHDFASLCRSAPGRSTVRRVDRADWSRRDDLVELDIAGSSFCHQMVRSVVAVSVDVGRGLLEPGAMRSILGARDRTVGRGAAPSRGLMLMSVAY